MKAVPQYDFYKMKYGEELLIDIVLLDDIKKYMEVHPVHTLSYFDITFIEDGEGAFSVDDKHYMVGRGDVVFSMPGEIRTWDKDRIKSGYALIFEEEFLLSFFNDPQFLLHLSFFNPWRISAKVSVSDIQTRVHELIRSILSEIRDYQAKDKHILRALLYEMLMLLHREYKKQTIPDGKNNSNRHAHTFMTLVNKDFRDHHDIKYYADKLCITPNHLNEVVKKTVGINVKLYIQNKLLLEAKKLLSYTSLSVSEISERLSFDNPSYFIRFFKSRTGFTPLYYRNNMTNP
ncbi:MAG: helix-turn-helix domain-containing protein [Tannerella sp.]|jgi:AraC-like DNA-binding protein|nr:helix-turn-helix domain-containing protein [Tannerella sp.]